MVIRIVEEPQQIRVLTIHELVDRYAFSNQVDGKSPATVKWYNDILRLFLIYLKENKIISNVYSLNINTVREYILYLRQKPRFKGHPYIPQQDKCVSPKTIQCHVRVFKGFSTWLYREGYTKENKLNILKLPKAPNKIIEPLTSEEIKQIIKVINKQSAVGFRNYAILMLLLDAGLRISGVTNITLADIKLKDGLIRVIEKGNKERVVPIGKNVQSCLWSYIDQYRPTSTSKCDNLFLSKNGRQITTNTIKLMFTKLAKKSKISRLHAHLCRHTFAINYLMNGGDIFSLKEILGHASLDMVNHYLHFTSSQITAQHQKYSPMDKLFSA